VDIYHVIGRASCPLLFVLNKRSVSTWSFEEAWNVVCSVPVRCAFSGVFETLRNQAKNRAYWGTCSLSFEMTQNVTSNDQCIDGNDGNASVLIFLVLLLVGK
jgi:hypothetical protein